MPNTKDSVSEVASLLCPEKHRGKFGRFAESRYETPIIKGAVTQLRRWPTDLLFAFLAACVILGSLVLLVFVTVAVCLPTVVGNRCRVEEISILETEASPNVYFFRLENQNWSTKDFCYVETAARRHPDLNVYLITLSKEDPLRENSNRSTEYVSKPDSKPNDSTPSNRSSTFTPEERLEERLVSGNSNIKSINLSIDRFFKGSKLSKIAKGLNDEVLLLAATAQLLWTVPGIALKPSMHCNVDDMKRFLCNRKEVTCLPDTLATIEPEQDVQATGIPCQAFMGFLVHEISLSNLDHKYTLREAVEKYCPRLYYCPEIRIVDSKPQCPDSLDCPAVYSSAILQDPGNFVT